MKLCLLLWRFSFLYYIFWLQLIILCSVPFYFRSLYLYSEEKLTLLILQGVYFHPEAHQHPMRSEPAKDPSPVCTSKSQMTIHKYTNEVFVVILLLSKFLRWNLNLIWFWFVIIFVLSVSFPVLFCFVVEWLLNLMPQLVVLIAW